jgi:hypothetical protein
MGSAWICSSVCPYRASFDHAWFDHGRPHKRSGFLVPTGEKLGNGRDEILDAQKGVAAVSLVS